MGRPMRRKRLSHEERSEINVTPMLDVVFILLIFFIVTASFVKEAAIDLGRFDAPVASEAESKANIIVAIGADGQLWINHRPITLEALRPNIERLHAEHPDAKVIVLADPGSKNGLLVRVIDTARLTGLYEVSLAVAGG
jgi:biopolymer transport protein ExbD